jgi:NAD(P)-dependent dehydrogenase (short-subunit alcohol dehydrogenase family)
VSGSAVVTGAARGFGLEIARRLVARGHAVVLCDVDEAQVKEAAASLGSNAHGMAADVRYPAAHRRVAAAAAELAPLEVWVNNAGVAPTAKAWEHDDEVVTRTVEVNLLGMMYGSRAAVDAMGARGGQILNLASLAGLGPVPGLGVYAATKAGVVSFTVSLQGDLDLAGLPIRMHVLCPDAADTRMVRDVVDQPDSALLFSGGGLLDPAEVADQAVAMLDGRRLVRTMPAWRSALVRSGALMPSVGLKVLRALRWYGDRRRPATPGR